MMALIGAFGDKFGVWAPLLLAVIVIGSVGGVVLLITWISGRDQ